MKQLHKTINTYRSNSNDCKIAENAAVNRRLTVGFYFRCIKLLSYKSDLQLNT